VIDVKRISPVPERCSGCRVCEMTCAQVHFNVMNPKKAALRVFSIFPNPVIRTPIVCRQCEDPECQKACPSDAIRMVDGILVINRDLCTNCLSCVDACPYGAIFVHPDLDSPIKCDLCGGKPQCVRACPKHALLFTDSPREEPRLVDGRIVYDRMEEVAVPGGDGEDRTIRYVQGGGPR
jgi:carbon-monoxide dehydrogenase iron sulfur subunit